MKQSANAYKRVVIKIGASLLCSERRSPDLRFLSGLLEQISVLRKQKIEVVLVSSGAIAFGMHVLKLSSRPKELAVLQAAAAVGQHELMSAYAGFFEKNKINCAQLLLTWEDFDSRSRYLNAKHTIETLLQLAVIPIINENDTVSTDEIKFGDNDKLSALVASLVDADLLIILSDVDGLLDTDRKRVIARVEKITSEIESLACPTDKKTCVGGMVTKIEAAKIAVSAGIPCVLANGRRKEILSLATKEPQGAGTFFVAKKEQLVAKKRWIAFSAKPKGSILVDDGAKNALLNKKSLLSVGILSIEGDFASQDIVSVRDKNGGEFARGRVSISSKQLEGVKGSRFDKEIIHRDNIVIL